MRLTTEETRTALWLKLSSHYEAELTALRDRNDTLMEHEDRLILVTRIREIKNFLALANPVPETVDIDSYVEP